MNLLSAGSLEFSASATGILFLVENTVAYCKARKMLKRGAPPYAVRAYTTGLYFDMDPLPVLYGIELAIKHHYKKKNKSY